MIDQVKFKRFRIPKGFDVSSIKWYEGYGAVFFEKKRKRRKK